MAVWVPLGLSIAGVGVLIALAFFWSRRARAQLRASQRDVEALRAELADLQRKVDLQQRQLVTRPHDAGGSEAAIVITSLGSVPDRSETPGSRIVLRPTLGERLSSGAETGLAHFLARPGEGPTMLRRVVDRSAVRVVSVGFGLVHALRPEVRDRIEFASRAGMRRSRRQREQELRLARRLVRAGNVVVSEDR